VSLPEYPLTPVRVRGGRSFVAVSMGILGRFYASTKAQGQDAPLRDL